MPIEVAYSLDRSLYYAPAAFSVQSSTSWNQPESAEEIRADISEEAQWLIANGRRL
jgi:hypothetical protein